MSLELDKIRSDIRNAQERLKGIQQLPRKSDVDLQLMDDLREYIAGLFENLGELKREEAGRERGW